MHKQRTCILSQRGPIVDAPCIRSAERVLAAVQKTMSTHNATKITTVGHSLGTLFPSESALESQTDSPPSRRRYLPPRHSLPPPTDPLRHRELHRLWSSARREPGLRELRRFARAQHHTHQQQGGLCANPAWPLPWLPPPLGRSPHPGLRRVGGVSRTGQRQHGVHGRRRAKHL